MEAACPDGQKREHLGNGRGSYDDFAIQTEIKKGESNLPGDKESGSKALNVSCNNGDVNIEFVNE